MYPILFKTGLLIIPSYSFMLSLSFIVGSLLFVYLGRKQMISTDKLIGLVILVQLSTLLGARLLFVINNSTQFESDFLQIFSLRLGGFSYNGGLLLGILVGLLYIKITDLSFWNLSDLASPSIAIGIILMKIGCFLGGCCYGKVTSLMIGVQFPEGSLAAQHYGLPHLVHPIQLYEAASGIFILLLILLMYERKKFDGQVFLTLIIIHQIVRSLIDTLMGAELKSDILSINNIQLMGAVIILVTIITYWMKLRSEKNQVGSRI